MQNLFNYKNNNNKHIRFTDDDSNDIEMGNVQDNYLTDKNDTEIFNKLEQQQQPKPSWINCNLVKFREESSFGFEIKGDKNKPGEHYLDSIEPYSASDRAGLKNKDKIIQVNTINVENLSAFKLIEVLERETSKTKDRLNFVVLRSNQIINEQSTQANFLTLGERFQQLKQQELDSNTNKNKNFNKKRKHLNKKENLSHLIFNIKEEEEEEREEKEETEEEQYFIEMNKLKKKTQRKESQNTINSNSKSNGIDISKLTSIPNMASFSSLSGYFQSNGLELANKIQSTGQSNPLMSQFLPALLVEQSFNQMTNPYLEDVDDGDESNKKTSQQPTKSLEQIRQEELEKIKFVSPGRPFKRANVPSKLILNAKAKEIQIKLSEQGKYVTWQEIIYELLSQYENCEHIGDLGLARVDQLQTISDLLRLQKRIDTFLVSAEVRMSCLTLLDLEKYICNDYNHTISNYNNNNANNPNTNTNTNNKQNQKVKKFEELFVGPLIKNQIVRQIFNIPDEIKSIQQLRPINLNDLFKHLSDYLNSKELWSSKNVRQTEFESYLVNKFRLKSTNELCVKINNIGLLIGSIKNVQHLFSESLKEIRLKLSDDLKQTFEQEKKWLVKQLTDKLNKHKQDMANNPNLNFIQTTTTLGVLSQSSLKLIEDLVVLFEKLFDKKDQAQFNNFFNLIRSSSYLSECFQLAVSYAKLDIDQSLVQIKHVKASQELDRTSDYCFNSLLKRLFSLIIDSRNYSNRDIKKVLNQLLRDKSLKIVSNSYKVFDDDGNIKNNNGGNDDDDDDEAIIYEEYMNGLPKIEDDDEDDDIKFIESTKKDEPLKTNVKSDKIVEISNLENKLNEFLKVKFEPNSILGFEHLIQLETNVWLSGQMSKSNRNLKNSSFIEYLFKNKYQFDKYGHKIILIDENNSSSTAPEGAAASSGVAKCSNILVNERTLNQKRFYLIEQLKQLEPIELGDYSSSSSSSNRSSNLINDTNKLNKLEKILCNYYKIKKFQELGVGISLAKLIEQYMSSSNKNCQESSPASVNSGKIIFIDSLFDHSTTDHVSSSSSSSSTINNDSSMIFDLVEKRNEILIKLAECPLLENINKYLNWNENYWSLFGDLKEFLFDLNRQEILLTQILPNNGRKSITDDDWIHCNSNGYFFIDLLETEPGVLLKITRNTDIDLLKRAIETGDYINACGHLVSLVSIKYKNLNQTPRSLLINEIQSSLSVYLNKCREQQHQQDNNSISTNRIDILMELNDDQSQSSTLLNRKFYSFLIETIYRLPKRLVSCLLFDYLIGPLVNIENDNQIKMNLFNYLVLRSVYFNFEFGCTSADCFLDDRVAWFIQIGEICSIGEWSLANYDLIRKQALQKLAPWSYNMTEPESTIKLTEALDSNVEQKIEETKEIEMTSVTNESQSELLNQKPDILIEANKVAHSIGMKELDEHEKVNEEHEHIMSIRQRYGIGIDLDEQGKSVTDTLKGLLGRSLESLSNELYNKDMHFVLELIQNADDNSYEQLTTSEPTPTDYSTNNKYIYEPTLIFLIEQDKITLFNNEIGFSQRNINAICDVKASTKGKHQRGYIGRKGIGFKSVFTITDRPEIHSNGYHIKFDLKNGHIGYILPNWISNTDHINHIDSLNRFVYERIKYLTNETEVTQLDAKIGSLNTCIQLPLKSESEMQRHKSSLLTNNFNDIKPYLLLFLNRLRNLVLIQKSSSQQNKERIYHREDLNENLIEIKSICLNSLNLEKTNTQKWLVVRKCLQVPTNLKPNDQVDATDLCLAFPIDQLANEINQSQQADNTKTNSMLNFYKPLPKMDVFAYLPLRSFGFSFIIQADFVVPASRQDVTQDSDWNQWLIKQIPQLFINSFDYFKQNSQFKSKIEALKAFLRFVPLEEEVVGFFQHIPRQIIELLRNVEFLPAIDCTNPMIVDDNDSASVNTNEITTVWKKPFECVIIREVDDLIRQVLTSDLLKKHLGRYYLHPSLLNTVEINPKLLSSLGVRYLNVNDLIEILKSVFSVKSTTGSQSESDRVDGLNFNDTKTTAKWLVVLQHCLEGYTMQQEETFIEQLKKLPFIPIIRKDETNPNQVIHELISIDSCNVFFPFSIDNNIFLRQSNKNDSFEPSLNIHAKSIEALIESDLTLLDCESLLCLDNLKNSQIVNLLKHLGVKNMEPKEVIQHHIMNVLKDKERLAKKSDSILVAYLVYLHDYWSSNTLNYLPVDLNKLKEFILIKTNKGFKNLPQTTEDNSNDGTDKESIYLTPVYGNKYDLKEMLPSYDWCLVDSIYLTKSIELKQNQLNADAESNKKNANTNRFSNNKQQLKFSHAELKNQLVLSWRRFLINFGINDLFVPKLKKSYYKQNDLKDKQDQFDESVMPFGKYVDLLQIIAEDEFYQFNDYQCKIFDFYTTNRIETMTNHKRTSPTTTVDNLTIKELSNLYRIIEENWENASHTQKPLNSYKYISVNVVVLKADKYLLSPKSSFFKEKLCESTYFNNLRTKKWICVETNKYSQKEASHSSGLSLQTKIELERPFNVFVKEQVFLRYYSLLVPYTINAPSKTHIGLSRDLGFKFEFNINEFVDLFKSWCSSINMSNEQDVLVDDLNDCADQQQQQHQQQLVVDQNEIQYLKTSKNFFASIQQMRNIYTLFSNYLNSYETKKDLIDKLNDLRTNFKFIFVPNEEFKLKTSGDFVEKVLIGKFYSYDQCYWHDPTNLFVKHNLAYTSEMPILLEKIYYDEVKGEKIFQIFKDFNVEQMPKLNDYVNLLVDICSSTLTNRTSYPYAEILNDVYTLYELLVDKCVELTRLESLTNKKQNSFISSTYLTSSTPHLIHISSTIKTYLLDLIKDKWIIPCYEKKWLPLVETDLKSNLKHNHPVLVDDIDLAEKFMDKLNMIVIPKLVDKNNSLHASSGSNLMSSTSFTDYCNLDNLNSKRAFFLFDILEVKLFSKTILLDLENITENLREAPQVQIICSKLVSHIQCFMYYRVEFKNIYEEFTSEMVRISEKLFNMKFYSVRNLENIYRCKHDPSIFVSVSNKSCLDTSEKSTYWKYFIRADLLENEKDIIKGFVKLFTKSITNNVNDIGEPTEKELTSFCFLMNQFTNFKLNEEDRREIEKDYKLKLKLPDTETAWSIKEVVLPPSSQSNELKTDQLNNNEQTRTKFVPNPNQQSNQLFVYEKLSRSQIKEIDETKPGQSIGGCGVVGQNFQNYSQKQFTSSHSSSQSSSSPSPSQYNQSNLNSQNTLLGPSNKSFDSIEKNMNFLASKMSNTFNMQSLTQRQMLTNNSNDEIIRNSIEWSETSINNLKELRQSIQNEDLNARNAKYISNIGRWGEIWVNEMLKKNYEIKLIKNEVKIEWMNEKTESGLPYDFRISINTNRSITSSTASASQTTSNDYDSVYFIEVKSTTKMNQESFPISYNELLFAHKFVTQFQIFRLYNAGCDDPNKVELKIIKDIPNLLNSHGIDLFIVI